jgi:hypothetical protein
MSQENELGVLELHPRREFDHAAALTGLHSKQYSRGFVVATYSNSAPHCLHVAASRVPFGRWRFRSRAAYRHFAPQYRRFPCV